MKAADDEKNPKSATAGLIVALGQNTFLYEQLIE